MWEKLKRYRYGDKYNYEQNQIGGSIIKISSKSTKIILNIGSNLEDKEIVVPEIDEIGRAHV